MWVVLLKTLAFVLMIGLGYVMKRKGILRAEDSQVLMKIIINITMPAALISGFRTFLLDGSLAFAIALGFGFNLLLIAAGWVTSLRRRPEVRALYLLNVPTYNIGNFVLPFVQGFLPSSAVLCLSMFDAGNNPIGAGIAYSAACSASGGEGRISLRDIVRKLMHSPPFLAYFMMMLLYIPGIRLPEGFFDFCQLFGQGNAFLAMFSLGLIFELQVQREDLQQVCRLLAVRYGLCIAAGAVVFLCTPFDAVTRLTLVLCLIGPITTLSIPFGLQAGCPQTMIAACSSLSLLISFLLSIAALLTLM